MRENLADNVGPILGDLHTQEEAKTSRLWPAARILKYSFFASRAVTLLLSSCVMRTSRVNINLDCNN